MEAIETLRREHRIVDEVCIACNRELDRVGHAHPVDAHEMERFVEFFRFFANACHDPKEEDLLYTMLHHKGLSWDDEPLASLVHEHEEMRVILEAAAKWLPAAKRGDQSAIEPLRHGLSAYTDLVRGHLKREEEGVFVTALDMLTEADHDELTVAFENVACDEDDEGVHEYFRELARELANYSV